MKFKCIIIDDEPIARQIVEAYCLHLPELEVIASCKNALQAKTIIETKPVDVVFLDINMPVLDGMAFLKTLRSAPQVIFTTAYKEFAHAAFDINACDYLLKPFSFDRFIQAIDKVKEKLLKDQSSQLPGAEMPFTYIKADGKIFKIDFNEIEYAEASGNNVKIVLRDMKYMPAMTFSSFEEMLPKSKFIRVHRSYIINKSRIQVIEGNRVRIGSKEIPIGLNYKEYFLKEIGIK